VADDECTDQELIKGRKENRDDVLRRSRVAYHVNGTTLPLRTALTLPVRLYRHMVGTRAICLYLRDTKFNRSQYIWGWRTHDNAVAGLLGMKAVPSHQKLHGSTLRQSAAWYCAVRTARVFHVLDNTCELEARKWRPPSARTQATVTTEELFFTAILGKLYFLFHTSRKDKVLILHSQWNHIHTVK
jgi:hypothetical protein